MTGFRSKVKMANSRWDDNNLSVKLSEHVLEELFCNKLLVDYRDHLDEVSSIQNKNKLQQWEVCDLIDAINRTKAMEVLIKYYFNESESTRIIGNHFDQDEEDEYEMSLLKK